MILGNGGDLVAVVELIRQRMLKVMNPCLRLT
jgi:hypothetical protein